MEGNFYIGYKILSIEYTAGEYDSDPKQDYTFGAITIGDSYYLTYGEFGDDFTGSYFELGYSKDVGDLSFGIALVFPDDELDIRAIDQNGGLPDEDVYLTLDMSYSFDLM